MYSLVPFLTSKGISRSSIGSMDISSYFMCKGGLDLSVISFSEYELDNWTCVSYGTTFLLEYT